MNDGHGQEGLVPIDVNEHGAQRDGKAQVLDRRLFMQLIVLTCQGAVGPERAIETLGKSLAAANIGSVIYADVNDPFGIGVLTFSEDPNDFVTKVRPSVTSPELAGVTETVPIFLAKVFVEDVLLTTPGVKVGELDKQRGTDVLFETESGPVLFNRSKTNPEQFEQATPEAVKRQPRATPVVSVSRGPSSRKGRLPDEGHTHVCSPEGNGALTRPAPRSATSTPAARRAVSALASSRDDTTDADSGRAEAATSSHHSAATPADSSSSTVRMTLSALP